MCLNNGQMPRDRILSPWEQNQKDLLLQALTIQAWNISKVARDLGIYRQRVYVLIERFGIKKPERIMPD